MTAMLCREERARAIASLAHQVPIGPQHLSYEGAKVVVVVGNDHHGTRGRATRSEHALTICNRRSNL